MAVKWQTFGFSPLNRVGFRKGNDIMEADFREMELLIYTWWTEDWSVSGRPLQ